MMRAWSPTRRSASGTATARRSSRRTRCRAACKARSRTSRGTTRRSSSSSPHLRDHRHEANDVADGPRRRRRRRSLPRRLALEGSFDATTGSLTRLRGVPHGDRDRRASTTRTSRCDGNWVVFNENDDNSAANNDGDCFYNRQARVKIMHFPPQAGDQPLDLRKPQRRRRPHELVAAVEPGADELPRHGRALGDLLVEPRLRPSPQEHATGTRGCNGDGAASTTTTRPRGRRTTSRSRPARWASRSTTTRSRRSGWPPSSSTRAARSTRRTARIPAFWLPFQDVTAHNHSAQWVATVQGGPEATAEGSGSSSSSGGNNDSGPTCNESGAACGSGDPLCCPDVVCCGGTCQYGCAQ